MYCRGFCPRWPTTWSACCTASAIACWPESLRTVRKLSNSAAVFCPIIISRLATLSMADVCALIFCLSEGKIIPFFSSLLDKLPRFVSIMWSRNWYVISPVLTWSKCWVTMTSSSVRTAASATCDVSLTATDCCLSTWHKTHLNTVAASVDRVYFKWWLNRLLLYLKTLH